jgi:hypothetical protein
MVLFYPLVVGLGTMSAREQREAKASFATAFSQRELPCSSRISDTF